MLAHHIFAWHAQIKDLQEKKTLCRRIELVFRGMGCSPGEATITPNMIRLLTTTLLRRLLKACNPLFAKPRPCHVWHGFSQPNQSYIYQSQLHASRKTVKSLIHLYSELHYQFASCPLFWMSWTLNPVRWITSVLCICLRALWPPFTLDYFTTGASPSSKMICSF